MVLLYSWLPYQLLLFVIFKAIYGKFCLFIGHKNKPTVWAVLICFSQEHEQLKSIEEPMLLLRITRTLIE